MAGDMRRDIQARDCEHGENGDMQDIADAFGSKKAHENTPLGLCKGSKAKSCRVDFADWLTMVTRFGSNAPA
jgi:hypothetical protein